MTVIKHLVNVQAHPDRTILLSVHVSNAFGIYNQPRFRSDLEKFAHGYIATGSHVRKKIHWLFKVVNESEADLVDKNLAG